MLLLLLLLLCRAGVGGFNTPIALGAPMLASLGHDPLTSLLVVVVFNTLASHMGSMGMAVWFGFKILGKHSCEVLCSLASRFWQLVFNTVT
jgi:L-lactate permease